MRMYELEPLGSSASQNHPVNVSQCLCGNGFVLGVTIANLLRVANYRYNYRSEV